MLNHMLFKHEDEDFSEVEWGMFIVAHNKSAFERQIEEAVMIEWVSKNTEIFPGG